jgi:hypothetical protein
VVAAPTNAAVNAVTGSHLSTTPGRDAANAVADAAGLAPPPTPGFITHARGVAQQAFNTLATDAKRYYQAQTSTQLPKSPVALIPGFSPSDRALGSVVADTASYLTSPVAVAAHDYAVGPAASVLDNLPAPNNTHTEWHGAIPHTYVDGRMTPEQQHAANEDAINTALLAMPPKGIKAGAVADAVTSGYAAKVAGVVNSVPPEVALDEAGNLTPEAQEHAAQAGVHPDDLKTGYQAAAESQAAQAQQPAAAGAAEPQSTGNLPETSPDQPVSFTTHAGEPKDLPATAQERLAQAQSEGVDLSHGQATQDFETRAKEEDLKGTSGQVQAFFRNQAQQIASAVERFKASFGDPEASAAERGQAVRDALTDLRASGKDGVTALYTQARQLAEGLGQQGANLLHLDTQPLLDAMRGIWSDEAVPDRVRNALKQQAAKYGLIGENPQTIEGETSVTLRDTQGNPAGKVSFVGQQEPLTVTNAEDLRQKINQLYDADDTKQTQALKPLIDQAVSGAVERAASQGTGDVGQAFKEARAAHVVQQQTFKAGDTVQKVLAWKRGTQTPTVLPENVIKTVLGSGKDAVTELKKVKAVLLSKSGEQSEAAQALAQKGQAAWAAIRGHAIEGIFNRATVLNANLGEGQLGAISGAKLRTEIEKFGVGKLKVLLNESEFAQLMKLRRIAEDATVPISGTTNPSGSGHLLARFMKSFGGHVWNFASHEIPVVGYPMRVMGGVVEAGAQKAAERATLKGITDFDAAAAAKADQARR